MGLQLEQAFQSKMDKEALKYAEGIAQEAEKLAEREARKSGRRIDPLDYEGRDIESARIEGARKRARDAVYGQALQDFEDQERRTGRLWRETVAEHQDRINSDVIV